MCLLCFITATDVVAESDSRRDSLIKAVQNHGDDCFRKSKQPCDSESSHSPQRFDKFNEFYRFHGLNSSLALVRISCSGLLCDHFFDNCASNSFSDRNNNDEKIELIPP